MIGAAGPGRPLRGSGGSGDPRRNRNEKIFTLRRPGRALVEGPTPCQRTGNSRAGRHPPEAAPGPASQAPRCGRRATPARRASRRRRDPVGRFEAERPRALRGRAARRVLLDRGGRCCTLDWGQSSWNCNVFPSTARGDEALRRSRPESCMQRPLRSRSPVATGLRQDSRARSASAARAPSALRGRAPGVCEPGREPAIPVPSVPGTHLAVLVRKGTCPRRGGSVNEEKAV